MRAASSPSASTVSGTTSGIGRVAGRRGDSPAKVDGLVLALRFQGENELKI
jgi:hypothetical protein